MGACGNMPQSEKNSAAKKRTTKSNTGTNKKSGTVKKAASVNRSAAKRPAKKVGSRGSAGAGKKRTSQKKRRKNKNPWWSWPVTVIMLVILSSVGLIINREMAQYREFTVMRATVSFDGFYPGISIDGVDVSGRELYEVLLSLEAHEKSLKDQISMNMVCGNQTWTVQPDDLDYHTDYEAVVKAAYQLGREGTVQQRYQAIQQLNTSGASFTITRGYDESLLKIITDQIAAELSYEAVNATVADFNLSTLEFTYTDSSEGRYVNAEQLYQDALSLLRSGTGGQTLAISQQVVQPDVRRSDLEGNFGMITEARTSTYGSNNNRINNIELALDTLNGYCIEPGETFSFNGVVGQRTAERGYKKAGAFADGMVTEELGGGICQVSTTLFNAAVKSDLAIVERQPHSRPVGYVDEGKDAAVSWPNQDFKFTNNTGYPVYILTTMTETKNRCIISMYGRLLPDDTSIIVEAEVTETLEPEEDRYIYTTELMTGQKQLLEEARQGCKAVAYKIYLDANEQEIRREVLCYSTYAAAGAVYKVGQ